jgi:hypothetical protein
MIVTQFQWLESQGKLSQMWATLQSLHCIVSSLHSATRSADQGRLLHLATGLLSPV